MQRRLLWVPIGAFPSGTGPFFQAMEIKDDTLDHVAVSALLKAYICIYTYTYTNI